MLATPIAERLNQRALFGAFCQIWLLACILGLRFIPQDASRWATYGITMLLIAYPYPHPVQVACKLNQESALASTDSMGWAEHC